MYKLSKSKIKLVKFLKLPLQFLLVQRFKNSSVNSENFFFWIYALSGKSASNYLRSVRLSKARKMIKEQKGNISEIAYSVGFSSPAYFTRCFKEEYGYPSSDLAN